MAFNLRIPSIILAFKGFVGGLFLCIMLPCSLGTYCISSSATRRAGGYNSILAKSLKNFNQIEEFKSVLKRLNRL